MRSELHDLLTQKAITWLGYKVTLRGLCYATEVSIDGSFVADAVVLGTLQWRFNEFYKDSNVQYRYNRQDELIFVFDSKVSIQDYYNSNPAHRVTIGNLHWIVSKKLVINPEQIVGPWGLLEMTQRGLHETKKPVWCETTEEKIYRAGYAILWANKHEPRRQRQKQIRKYIKGE